jgi:hypothetical protein
MTEGPTSATSMWTSEPRQFRSVARVDFRSSLRLQKAGSIGDQFCYRTWSNSARLFLPQGFLPGVSCPSLSDDRS